MPVSSEHVQIIAELREKSRSGTMTIEDTKQAIKFLRAEREAAPQVAAKKKAVDTDSLFNELDNL